MVRSPSIVPPSAIERWIVGFGLVPDARPPVVDADELVRLLPWAQEHRVTGLLWAAAQSLGQVPEAIVHAHVATLRQALAVEAEACRALDVLQTQHIDSVVLKGVASAHVDYDDPSDRTFYDVDILVGREDLAAAAAALGDAGWTHVPSALGTQWEARFARAVQLVSPNHVEIDLHAAVGAGYFSTRLDLDAMWSSLHTFELGGRTLRCFDRDSRLVTSCFALVLTRGGSLRLVRDVAQQALASGSSFERAAVLAGDGDVVVAGAVDMVHEWIPLPAEVVEWAQSVRSSRVQRAGMALARRAQTQGWRADAFGELLGLGPRRAAAFFGLIVSHRLRSAARRHRRATVRSRIEDD